MITLSENIILWHLLTVSAFDPVFQFNDGVCKGKHCMKSVQIRSFFWYVFSRIKTEYGDLLRKSPYSVCIQENAEKLRIWTLFT